MGIILWILFGGIVGWLASIVTHNNDQMGIIRNVIVGLIGSVIGGWIASAAFGINIGDFFSWQGLLFSVIGAIILLVIVNFFMGRKRL